MELFLQQIKTFWRKKIHRPISSLITTIGVFGLISCIVVIYVFAQISDEVLEKEAFGFDKTILLWIHHNLANPVLDRIMLFITYLGNPNVVVVLVTIIMIVFLWRKYYQEAKIFAVDCAGGVILSYELKTFFSKTRPQLWDSPLNEVSYSYPSGHALGSAVLYVFLGYVLANRYPKFAPLIYTCATLLILLIGFSRLYLGVHWPTDIIGGYCIGFLWAVLCITMLKLLTSKQQKQNLGKDKG